MAPPRTPGGPDKGGENKGMVPAEGLDQLAAAAREVDMDEVRRKIAARKAEEEAGK